MSAEDISPSERIADAFARLSESAKNLNAVSDELSKPVRWLEQSLERLNLGVVCWTIFAEHDDGDEVRRQYVGYAQIKGTWAIAISVSEGPSGHPERTRDETWPFDEAPRHFRVKAVEKLPDLVEALVKTADATASRLKKRVEPTKELARAVREVTQKGTQR